MKILCNRIAFTRAIANVAGPALGGPMQDDQRKAMFAKMSRGGGSGSRGGGGRSSGGNDRKVAGGMVVAKAPIASAPVHGSIQVPSVPVFRKPNPDPNWGPKDGRGNTIKPPEGSHWETRDGTNFYPVPDDPRLIVHPMSGGLDVSAKTASAQAQEAVPARTVDSTGRVSLPMSGPITSEQMTSEGGLAFKQNAAPVDPARFDLHASDVFAGEYKSTSSLPGMSDYANSAVDAINQNWEYPKQAKKYFIDLLKHYGNPTDAQVRRALQLTEDAYDINSGPGIRTFSLGKTAHVDIPALVKQFRFGTLPAPKKFSDFGPNG
ncbi:MAG TPA: hypothetical protein DCZ95_14950 [Verrucomicrobia bacterium]|nr:MAG: hypothetical protein A2X46_15580 [Lentisphaerae bacterium GWF2_57_35]HBA85383.1 hypothetical protein [Verrucomicrobiota bacterium]